MDKNPSNDHSETRERRGLYRKIQKNGAQCLGLVTLEQMLQALLDAVEWPATGMRVLGVAEIRARRANAAFGAASAR